MMQFGAVLLDSLRLLRSRYLFRLTLILSSLAAVALFATYSFNEQGIRILWFNTWENPELQAGKPGVRDFIAIMFNNVYARFWLTWGAMILAIVSTASILPDFLSSGSIELSLARPISRTRMLAFRVIGALLFVFLQTFVGVLLAYLIIGLKFNIWLGGILWAIPLITLMFFCLFSYSALLAVITRSTLACVIGTLLIWFVLFLLQFSSSQLNNQVEQARAMQRQSQAIVARIERITADQSRPPTPGEERSLSRAKEHIARTQIDIDRFGPYASVFRRSEFILPKTRDMQTILANRAKVPTGGSIISLFAAGRGGPLNNPEFDSDDLREQLAAADEAEAALRDINVPRSLGTSIASALFIYGLAALIFSRRDF